MAEPPAESDLEALRTHRFPGGTYRIQHWESWLLTDCTAREPLPDGLAHPIALFHVPILGAGTSIAELFELAGTEATSGSVALLGYDWEYLEPLREDVTYRADGGIASVERRTSASGAVADDLAFTIELTEGRRVVARVTNRWRVRRTPPEPVTAASATSSSPGPAPGPDELPPWEVASVDPARMKTMAAILRDPYPVHWDREANARLGLGGRVVNQGPLNLGYVANMLMAWAGPASIRRLTAGFARPVLDGDRVVARGRVVEVVDGIAHCEVLLDRAGEAVVTGTAEVVAPG